jgi:uncharacterized SAM-binding protein YcdF (DUF218 family)
MLLYVMRKKSGRIWKILKTLLITTGCIFIMLCILAFTTLPFWAYYALGTNNSKITQAPATIVLLGGAGIPSGDGLLRTYYTAKLSNAYSGALVIIAMPGNSADSLSAPQCIKHELIMRGVNAHSIFFENTGRNTREQAQKLATGITIAQLNKPITLVTSPEHMKRAVLAFRKCGFTKVSGLPTFEIALDANLAFRDNDLKGNPFVPPIGNNLQLRYQFWNHLKYEVIVVREYFALAYYWLRDWI